MADCYKFQKLINDSIDNKIDTAGKKQLEDHIKQCVSCSMQLKNALVLQRSLKTLPKYKTSASFELVLRSKLRNEMYNKPAFSPLAWLPTWRPVPVIATLGILFIIFGYFMAGMIHNSKTPVITQQPGINGANTTVLENIPAVVTQPASHDGYIKMKNYVNIAEQLPGNRAFTRELSEIQANNSRIEQVQSDSIQKIMPRRLNKPLIRQANTIVHF